MFSRRLFILLTITLLLVGCQTNPNSDQPTTFPAPLNNVDHTASLAIFIKGIKYDLTKPIYTHQSDLLYLESKFPGIVSIKKSPLAWGELFATTPLGLDQDCLVLDARTQYCPENQFTLKVFLDGTIVSDLANRSATDGDQVLISYGDETGVELTRQLNQIP